MTQIVENLSELAHNHKSTKKKLQNQIILN